jgi:hypothetical protein
MSLLMSRSIPIAAATGSSTRNTSLAACFSPESLTALLSTSVATKSSGNFYFIASMNKPRPALKSENF